MPPHVFTLRAALENPCGTGEEADLIDHRADLLGQGQRGGLAGVLDLDGHQLVGVRLDVVGELQQRVLPLARVEQRQVL